MKCRSSHICMFCYLECFLNMRRVLCESRLTYTNWLCNVQCCFQTSCVLRSSTISVRMIRKRLICPRV
jgi:hypothetical protein